MTQIFDGTISVSYGQAYVFTYRGADFHLDDCFVGQNNGLCGTAFPGVIWLTTGLHSGEVNLSIEVFEAPPPFTDEWEEIVEAPFSIGSEADEEGARIDNWYGDRVCKIPIPRGNYRVRYCARKMDQANDIDTLVEGEPIDSYGLYFWPAELSPDAVIKQKSHTARYWHRMFSQNPSLWSDLTSR
jgi:hypothetical protein